ncbi:glycosyltransferase family 2 protein [Cerasicoccus frondis]|uniref:glycosyltransferase family 2 protein n=1 Tax=Cerasicoccus frondis TaxID=490090 RepID=UPI002852A9FD|nr:glycosyltransferase family 2 protein [Cerasicoccus frondis]
MSIDISVLIPAYQAEKYLAETLASVHAQTFSPAEIIVVNDGSTDATGDIASAHGASIIHHETNLGISDAVNHGIAQCRCEWVAFLDADDLWLPEKLSRQVERLNQLGKAAEHTCVFTHLEQFISPDLSSEEKAKIVLENTILPGAIKSTLLMHRSVFDRVGKFDRKWRVGDFIDWYARAKELGIGEAMLPDVLARRRIHASNMSRKDHSERKDMAAILLQSIKRRRAMQNKDFSPADDHSPHPSPNPS